MSLVVTGWLFEGERVNYSPCPFQGQHAVIKMRLFARVLCLEGYDDLAAEATESLKRLVEELGEPEEADEEEERQVEEEEEEGAAEGEAAATAKEVGGASGK